MEKKFSLKDHFSGRAQAQLASLQFSVSISFLSTYATVNAHFGENGENGRFDMKMAEDTTSPIDFIIIYPT